MADSWSDKEVEAIVKDYFDMMSHELQGKPYNKSEHRRRLMGSLNGRSHGSIERKHQNISAVLIEMGMPYISGYKPLKNYQRLVLPDAISDFLSVTQEMTALMSRDAEIVPVIPSVDDFLNTLVDAPEPHIHSRDSVEETAAIYSRNSIDYLEKEASNISLGAAGEEFVMNFERARLIACGREKLAEKIEQISATVGDYAGFDIRSYEENGQDRFIEAKTTKYGIDTPFYISPNELRFSESHQNSYHLYRVFQFRETPRLFTLAGNVRTHVELSPVNYMARL